MDKTDRTCQWFAMCGSEAVAREPHPAFPDGVPICDDCLDWVRANAPNPVDVNHPPTVDENGEPRVRL